MILKAEDVGKLEIPRTLTNRPAVERCSWAVTGPLTVVTLAVVTVFAVLQKRRKDEDMDAARRVMEPAASVGLKRRGGSSGAGCGFKVMRAFNPGKNKLFTS